MPPSLALMFFAGRLSLLSFVLCGPALAAGPLFVSLDLERGKAASAVVGGREIRVRLLELREMRDAVEGAIREARITLELGRYKVEIGCGNYELPRRVGYVQVDCPVTAGYRGNSTADHWGLEKDARVRLWPGESEWIEAALFGYPVKQRWFATHTQMSNEPTYVDRGETSARKKIYYHSGLDLGGAEGLTEVVAATDGEVVSSGDDVLGTLPGDNPVAKRYDVVYLRDDRGWYYRYSHLHTIAAAVKPGVRVKRGDLIGILGKEGGSGGWSHLHFEIKSRQPSGKWGTEEGYAFLWQAWLKLRDPAVMAVARPHRVAVVGEPVKLDASKSWSATGRIPAYEWTFTDGSRQEGRTVERTYLKPGTYSEVLRITDGAGHAAYDFATVNVMDPEHPELDPITIHASFFPTEAVKTGDPVRFKVRTFGTTEGEEVWDFGDGSAKVKTKSDGNAVKLAKDGYAETSHAFAKAGDYVIRVERTDGSRMAVTHLWVHVE